MPNLRELSVALGLIGLGVFGHWCYRVVDGTVSRPELSVVAVFALVQLALRFVLPGARITKSTSIVHADQTRTAALKRLWEESLLADNDRFAPEMMADYADILLNPPLFRSRTTESLDVGREVTIRTLLIHFKFETAAALSNPNGLIVPLLVPPKRRLYDQAKIEDEHGELLSPLNTLESTRVSVRLVQYLYRSALKLDKDMDKWSKDEFWDFAALMDVVCRSADMIEPKENVAKILNSVRDSAKDDVSFRKLENIVKMLSERYIVAVIVKNRVEATLSFTSQLATKNLTDKIPNSHSVVFSRWTHALLRIPSGYLKFSMSQARRCQSYHLYVTLPSRSFVGPVVAKIGDAELKVEPGTGVVSADPVLRLSKRQRGLLHVYGRGLSGIPAGAEIQGRFYERPYGSELFGMVAAISFLILCVVLRESFLGGHDVDPGAVSLAVPVGLATFGTLFSASVRNSVTVSSAGMTCGVLTSLLAVIAFAVYLLQESADDLGPLNGHGLVFWHWVVTIAAVIAAAITGIFVLRFGRYIADAA